MTTIASSAPTLLSPQQLAQYIDHTLLRPEAQEKDIRKLCEEAKEFGFKTVCIESQWIPFAVTLLKNSSVMPITVISFPHGTDPSAIKAEAAVQAVRKGAREIDMVLDRRQLQARHYDELF